MTKAELIQELRAACPNDIASDAAGKRVVNAMMGIIRNAVTDGDSVVLSRFGTFYTAEQGPRKGRHPVTGEIMDIPPTKRVGFHPSKQWKREVKAHAKV